MNDEINPTDEKSINTPSVLEEPEPSPKSESHNGWKTSIPSWLMAIGTVVSSIATALLAFYTYSTLNEVKAQRNIVQKSLDEQAATRKIMLEQLNMSKIPEITINRPSPFEIGEYANVTFRVSNYGGPANNIKCRIAIFRAESTNELLQREKILVHDGYQIFPQLTRNINITYPIFYSKDDWVYKLIIDKDNKIMRVYAFIGLEYTGQYRLDSNEQNMKYISRSYGWDPVVRAWGLVSPEDHQKIKSFVSKLAKPSLIPQ